MSVPGVSIPVTPRNQTSGDVRIQVDFQDHLYIGRTVFTGTFVAPRRL